VLFMPLSILTAVQLLVAYSAPGASYLFQLPLIATFASAAVFIRTGNKVDVLWKLLILAATPSFVVLLLIPIAKNLIIALGPHMATSLVSVDILLIMICLSPQILFLTGMLPFDSTP
jgi:hypothetical protein